MGRLQKIACNGKKIAETDKNCVNLWGTAKIMTLRQNVRERPIRVKWLMSDVPIFWQKNCDVRFRCLVVYQNSDATLTRNSLDTVATVSLSAMVSRHQSHHVTDDAGHQHTRLLMLAITSWLSVSGKVK